MNYFDQLTAHRLILAADEAGLGDRLFQKRLVDLAKVEAWTDAALLIAEAANNGPLKIVLKHLDARPSAQIGDDQPCYAPSLAMAILEAVEQHRELLKSQG